MIVLQKFIAQSGYCSRRKAEKLIKNNKVRVNGRIAMPGLKISESDDIRIHGEKIELTKKIYIMLNKPKGYTCTNRKFPGEMNVFDLINGAPKGLFVVGRLDKESRGLVLLTNDGELTLKLTHPRYEHEKEYIVKISNIQLLISKNKEIIFELKKGVDIGENDGIAKAKDVKFLGENKFKIILTEGKKRQIRRMFNVLGYRTEDIQRTRINNLKLGNLHEGKWRYLQTDEIINLNYGKNNRHALLCY